MKSYVDGVLTTIFDEQDKRVIRRKICERNRRAWSIDSTDIEMEIAYLYCINAEYAKDRLEIMGFTMVRAREAFESGLSRLRQTAANARVVVGLHWLSREEVVTFLSHYTFANWTVAIQNICDSSFFMPKPYDRPAVEQLEPALRLVCEKETEDFCYGFPCCDPRLFVRAVLEVTNSKHPVILDYSDLVNNGYHSPDEPLVIFAKTSIASEFTATAKIIVLTEGSTDATFLQQSLRILYPHLEPLFSFANFAESNMEGGAANLVRIIKGFVGSGVVNNTIAIFDNDTAASVARKSLQSVSVPKNMKIMQYPSVPYASNYPTIGPQGNVLMNVNGLAGSIELYFGSDILRQQNGELVPVQWKGYDQTLLQYQGELINKRALQQAFQQKLDRCSDSSSLNTTADWSGMKLIFEAIFSACSTT